MLTFAGPGAVNVSGVIDGGSGTIAVSATGGTTTLTRANTYAGGTTVNAGVVNVANNGALGSGTVTETGGKVSLQAVGASIAGQFNVGSSGQSLLATDSTGAVPQNYWTVSTTGTIGTANSGNLTALHDSNNIATTAAVTWTSNTAWTSTAGSGAFAKLMSCDLKPNVATNGITLTFSNIPYSTYNVYIYENDNQNNSHFSINDATTTYYGQTDNGLSTFQRITSTTSGTYGDGNYVEFIGETAAGLTIKQTGITGGGGGICGFQIVGISGATYGNNFAVTGNATLDETGSTAATIGSLTVGSQTLSVTGSSSGTNAAYTLTTGAVTVNGNPTFDVAKNGSGTGTLLLGSLAGDGTPRTITIQDNGSVTLTGAVTSLIDGSAVNVNSGTLNLNAAGALGSLVNVTLSDSANVNLGANQTLVLSTARVPQPSSISMARR